MKRCKKIRTNQGRTIIYVFKITYETSQEFADFTFSKYQVIYERSKVASMLRQIRREIAEVKGQYRLLRAISRLNPIESDSMVRH